ncbi:CPBP family intramembrane metalloprotease [Kribbella antibiotica]|uniref:CPBP family intramembrane metalloprotease n=1 Tax=Kribbella antibiotica TaxID=190195 RepID=A0A4R4YKS7_9ACTN|nr:CPBP family intramembrane glutamic endopeptidase [Kribbella antibiotica]TDD45561.1 CPBP family intramembrane metalloprotease [Kribbella antibiotica]
MTIVQPATPLQAPQTVEPVTYERLARVTGRHNWWRPIVGTAFWGALSLVGVFLIMAQSMVLGAILGLPTDAEDLPILDEVTSMGFDLVSIAIGIPALALVVWAVQRRTLGSLTSVTGRLRLGWIGRCLAVAAVLIGLSLGAMLLIEPDASSDSPWVGWPTFALGLVMLICLVPFQAAAEEYFFRGWLLQSVGAFVRWPILALIPQALLFAAAHGWGTVWGFIDLTVFGLVMGWLTIRTGGLEAAIALHVANNLIAMVVASAFKGGLASDETAADLPWQYAAITMTTTVVFAVLILQLAKRYKPATQLAVS